MDVVYTNIDGMHFFTSHDEESKGLCVAHKDLNVAYSEVGKQLAYLLLTNHAKKAVVKPQKSVDEFKSWLKMVENTGKDNEIIPLAGGIIKWKTESAPCSHRKRSNS